MKTLITGGTIVNEGHAALADLILDNDRIAAIGGDGLSATPCDNTIDASGCYVLPGIIDEHVHFREPGMTDKADMESESRAAAAGGVTTIFDMPNTVPQTTTLEALRQKQELAAAKCHVNYAFFFGATNDNFHLFRQLDPHAVPGIKLFMGSSTGNMLVDDADALENVFVAAAEAKLPIMAHCEDTTIIGRNMAEAQRRYGDDPPIACHPLIRSEEACTESTLQAIELGGRRNARLHIAHVTTAAETEYFFYPSKYPQYFPCTAEATVGHLLFCDEDYARLGTRIKVNPAIKTAADREALRRGLMDGRISTVATDHAPHLLSQKQGGCARAASGMPMVQFSLVSMLGLVDEGVLSIERLVELMAHNPARIFEVRERGFLQQGYKADIVIVRPNAPWTLTPQLIESKCGWSPLEGRTFNWRVETTICNGHILYNNGVVDVGYIAEPVRFR